jgi:Tol biopolymer transport system component
MLLYESGVGPATNQMAIFDRTGEHMSIMKGVQGVFEGAFSPDAGKIAFSSVDPQRRNEDIWVYDIARALSTRLTFDPKDDTDPIWSPDGKQIAFSSNRTGVASIYVKNADGTGSEKEVFASSDGAYPTSWSKDGKWILCTTYGNRDIIVVPASGGQQAVTFLKTEFAEDEARFSPDGKWIVYASTESGQREMYVRPFPGPGGKWQVSVGGAFFRPFWRADGKEIYYPSRDGRMMAAEVSSGPGTFSVGAVRALFEGQSKGMNDLLAVSPNGQKFLVVYNPVEAKSTHVTLVSHWDTELQK